MSNSLIRERATKAIADKVFPGCVVGITNKTGERNILPFGNFTYETDASPVLENTVYDTASITKTIPVALIALKFVEQEKLSLEDKIMEYVPEITTPHADEALIRHLLTYTYVLKKNSDPNFSYEHLQAKDVLDFLYKRELEYLPGTHYQYGNAPANLLGVVLERLSGEKLYTLAQKMIFEPLGMHDSTFHLINKELIPPTEITSWRGEIQGIVHDETAYLLQNGGFDPGCAGLFSSVGDLLNVAEMTLNEGLYKGDKIFDKRTIDMMKSDALEEIGQSHGIGWELNQPRFMGRYTNESMIGKTGFTGTCCIVDPISGLAMVLLSNRTYPKRGNSDAFYALRRDIADIVFAP